MPYENIHRYKASPPRYGTAALLVSTFLFLAACTAPDGPNHHSVKRDFEWTIDTIRYGGATQLFFYRMAGTQDGTVYATASSNSSDYGGKFWQFSNNVWRNIPLDRRSGGTLFDRVRGLSRLDAAFGGTRVWMTGVRSSPDTETGRWVDRGLLISYDGIQFEEINLPDISGTVGILALRDNLVFFGALESSLFCYDGNTVRRYPIPVQEIPALSELEIRRLWIGDIAGTEDRIIITLFYHYEPGLTGFTHLIFRNKSTWTVGIPTVSNVGSEPRGGLWTSPEGNVYTCGDRSIFRFESGSWVEIYESYMASFERIWGVSDRDFWASGFSTVYHFAEGGTGVPHFPIPIPPAPKAYVTWLEGWSNGREVFVIGQPWIESDMGIIAHGK